MVQHEIIHPFSPLWWQATLISIMVIVGIFGVVHFIPKKKIKYFSFFIGSIILVRTVWFHLYVAMLGKWSLQNSLPLHLCGLSSIIAGVIFFYQKQWLYELLYYWGIPGALHSFLTPEFTQGTEGMLFIDYYISHGGILFSAIFCTLYLGFSPRKGSWWKIFVISQLLLPTIGFVNLILDANYMYICSPPIVDNPFVMGKFPFHLIGFEIAGIIHFFAVYLPFGFKYHREKTLTHPDVLG